MNEPDHEYQLVMELMKSSGESGGQPLANVPLKVDFAPALECARFSAQRRGTATVVDFGNSPWRFLPRWDARAGEPYVATIGLVSLDSADSLPASEIPLTYFAAQARKAAAELVEEGRLQAGDEFSYRICAYRRQPQPPDHRTAPDLFWVEDEPLPLSLEVRELKSYLARATAYGEPLDDDLPVFVPRTVLDESLEMMRAAGPVEVGGILIGHLHRDPSVPELFIEVTAQIPARHARQELTRLTFTAETWTDVDHAVRLRGRREMYLGWWHTHPAREWCRECPVERRRTCKLSGDFFSEHDVALHRCVFPRAYSVALVVSDSYAEGLNWPLFGWRQGQMQRRGYYVLDGAGAGAATVVAS